MIEPIIGTANMKPETEQAIISISHSLKAFQHFSESLVFIVIIGAVLCFVVWLIYGIVSYTVKGIQGLLNQNNQEIRKKDDEERLIESKEALDRSTDKLFNKS